MAVSNLTLEHDS